MEDDINSSKIALFIREIDTISLLRAQIANKYSFLANKFR